MNHDEGRRDWQQMGRDVTHTSSAAPGAIVSPAQIPTVHSTGASFGRALPPGAGYALSTSMYGSSALDRVSEGSASSNGARASRRDGSEEPHSRYAGHADVAESRDVAISLPTPPPSRDSVASAAIIPTSMPPRADLDALHHPRPASVASFAPLSASPLHTAAPLSISRPSLPVSPASAPVVPQVVSDMSADDEHKLPLQFSPIPAQMDPNRSAGPSDASRPSSATFFGVPGGRLPPTSLSGPSAAYRHSELSASRTSNIPSFVPAAAFSAGDRGPYPPVHRASSSTYQDGAASIPSALLPGGKGKQRESDPADADVRHSLSKSQRPSIEISTNVQSMVGVGRNSLMRNSYSPSSPKQQLLGLAPLSPTGPSPASSPAQQAQFAPQGAYTSPRPLAPGGQLPPHLVPQPEICVECMMRDRDMADVDVIGEGIWDRESDAEYEEALRLDALAGEVEGTSSVDHFGGAGAESEESGSMAHSTRIRRRSRDGTNGSRESAGGRSSAYGALPRKKLGRGQPLTVASLKLWTSMNPPASAHRWRTLQGYLATQIHLIEMERHAREATAAERDRAANARAADARQSAPALLGALANGGSRHRSSTLLSNGLVVENINIKRDEKQARERAKNKSRASVTDDRQSLLSLQPYPTMPVQTPNYPSSAAGAPSVQSYSHGDQPWLQSGQRRFSAPGSRDPNGPPTPGSASSSVRGFNFGKFARSSTDLRSINSPRSVSPARTSLGVDERRGSVWSKFRQSASQSVLSFTPSFAPSGSMMDMHLGLSQDHHRGGYGAPYETYPSMSDPAVARHVEQERDKALAVGEQSRLATAKPKKRGIKSFFSKLVGGGSSSVGGDKKRQSDATSVPRTAPAPDESYDDYDLAPPPPLSALANEPRYHGRSPSSSSVDSFSGPYTPPQTQSNFRLSAVGNSSTDFGSARQPADRGSTLTVGSFTSSRSKSGGTRASSAPAPAPGGAMFRRPSADSLDPGAGLVAQQRTVSPDPYSLSDRNGGEAEVLEDDPATAMPSLNAHGHHQPRLQKSLPSLPSEMMAANHSRDLSASSPSSPTNAGATVPYPFLASPPPNDPHSYPYSNRQGSRSAVSVRSGASGLYDDASDWGDDGLGGGRKSKAKSKMFSLKGFGSLGRRKGQSEMGLEDGGGYGGAVAGGDTAVRVAAMNGIARDDGLVSVHY